MGAIYKSDGSCHTPLAFGSSIIAVREINSSHGSGAMAEAEIRGELEQVRAALEMMRAELEVLRNRGNWVANKLSEIEANYAQRLTTLEMAYIARDREHGHQSKG